MSQASRSLFAELGRPLDDPALESFRRLFGPLLDSFEIVMASRLLSSQTLFKS